MTTFESKFTQLAEEARHEIMVENYDDPEKLAQLIYELIWRYCADFHLIISDPVIEPISPPLIIPPDTLANGQEEFVYPIEDFGYKLATSKGSEMFLSGWSMCKLFYTIEKMIAILIERIESEGIDTETQVQIAFEGHELAQRKAFESVINLSYNVVVTNFDPGKWGEQYLQTIKFLSDNGYGYPQEAPRTNYRHRSVPPPTPK